MDLNIRIAGEAGQGIETAGEILTQTLAGMGFYVYATKSYMSRIRGGLNWFNVRFGDKELTSERPAADIFVSLTEQGVNALHDKVSEKGIVLYEENNASSTTEGIGLPLEESAKQAGSKVMANMAAAGAVFGLLPFDIAPLLDCIRDRFEGKSSEVADKNSECARAGAELVEDIEVSFDIPEPAGATSYIASGTEAVAIGAATAGVKVVSAYPMTPATGIVTYLAGKAHEYGIVFEQAEDEIAAINMVCGAAYAGSPAMTATSGGGFALMTEGLSLSGMLELPVMIVISQRPGPATGLPTRTAQQDLRFAVHAGHGEFPRAIFAPGDLQEAFKLSRHALQIAHKFQVPSILMVDQCFVDHVCNTEPFNTDLEPIDRYVVEPGAGDDYKRYEMTPSGVSPRAVPGGEVFVKVDSDEHDAEGHITEDLDIAVQQQDKRRRKNEGLLEDWVEPERYGPSKADKVLICWGSTKGAVMEAVDMLNNAAKNVAMVHFPQVWPLDVEKARSALQGSADGEPELICVEGNATAQFAGMLREAGIIGQCRELLKYNGMQFTGEEIAGKV